MAAVADAVAKAGLLSRLGGLAAAARTAGVKVVHATFHSRADQWGGNRNSRLFAAARRADVQQVVGTPAVDPTPELGYEPGVDVVLPRFHGLSADSGSGLSAMLHNEGITTVVVAGVTLNVAIPNTVFDLVNAGYQVVVPTDGSVATPVAYGDQVLAHTLAYVATLSDVTTLTEAWLQA